MKNVFLHQSRKKSAIAMETAPQAKQHLDEFNRRFLVFEDGERYEGVPGEAEYRVVKYKIHGVYIEDTTPARMRTKRAAMPTSELWASDKLLHKTELQWRISLPLLLVILSVMAVPLSYTTPRKGRYSKLALAIFVYLIYTNILVVAETWMQRQQTPELLGLWWVHVLFILLTTALIIKRLGWRQFVMRKKAPAI